MTGMSASPTLAHSFTCPGSLVPALASLSSPTLYRPFSFHTPCSHALPPQYRPAAGYNTSAPTATAPAYDNAAPGSNGAVRVSTDYGIYKKSCAMNVKMLPPTWGIKGNTRVLERQARGRAA